MAKELNLKFYLILINLNLSRNSHMWLPAVLLDNSALDLGQLILTEETKDNQQ